MMCDENYGLLDKRSAGAKIFARQLEFDKIMCRFDDELLEGKWVFTEYDEETGKYLCEGGTAEDVERTYNEILRSQAKLLNLNWDRLLAEYDNEVKTADGKGFRLPDGVLTSRVVKD